jgi:spore coat protein U-like protein
VLRLRVGWIVAALLPAAAAGAACTNISSTNLAFGNYDVFNAAPTDSAAVLSYNCTGPPTVTFGASFLGAMNPRQMFRFGPDRLNYDIYVNAARTQVWGATGVVLPTGNQNISFYGRIFAGQDVTAGAYFDFITITLNF